MPVVDLATPPIFMAPPPALPSILGPHSAPGASLPAILPPQQSLAPFIPALQSVMPLQAGQQQSPAPSISALQSVPNVSMPGCLPLQTGQQPLPSTFIPSLQSAPSESMPGMLPSQAGQQQSQAPRFPGLNIALTNLLSNFADFKFTAEPAEQPEGAAGSDSRNFLKGIAMDDILPPPRSAPAAVADSRLGASMLDVSRECNESFIQYASIEAPYGRSLAPLVGEGSDKHILSVMTSDNTWDSLAFNSGGDIEKIASSWLQKRGLNPAFQRGLVAQMRQMVNSKLITAAVDIVDLL